MTEEPTTILVINEANSWNIEVSTNPSFLFKKYGDFPNICFRYWGYSAFIVSHFVYLHQLHWYNPTPELTYKILYRPSIIITENDEKMLSEIEQLKAEYKERVYPEEFIRDILATKTKEDFISIFHELEQYKIASTVTSLE